MSKMSQKAVIVAAMLISFLTSACEGSPKAEVVKSKNDGSFDIGIIQSAEENSTANVRNAAFVDDFSSTDGTVDFEIRIQQEIASGNMPVVEVAPHYLTSEDVQRVAKVLLGDIDYYELEPLNSSILSKSEIQEKLNRWSQYTNEASVAELYGDATNATDIVNVVKSFIVDYTERYELAPDKNPHQKCQWNFKKESMYLLSDDELRGLNLENDNDSIQATGKVGDAQYVLVASSRNKADYKLNNISVSLYDGLSPNMIDERIFEATLCRTHEPDSDQLTSVKTKAENILEQMELGDWLIDECYVSTSFYGSTPEYKICINAVPVFHGVPAIRRPQLNNLKSDEAYASNYYLSDVNFEFSGNGDLISFKLYSPVDVVETINENVQVLALDELFEQAKVQLSLSDIYTYGFGTAVNGIEDEVRCKVSITDLEYALTRVKVPNTDESYYYVPAIMFLGNITYYGEESDDIYFYSENNTVLILNCVDGTVINISNS